MSMERITADVVEATEQHVPVAMSMTHSSFSEMHWLRRPLHELEASPSHMVA